MATLPFALIGGLWLMYLLGYNMSLASAVGFIALGGVAAEIGVVMLVYVNQHVETARSSTHRARTDSTVSGMRGLYPFIVRLLTPRATFG